jgi:cell division protease FtsH
VAGLEHVVTEVSEVVTYLSNPKRFHALGAHPPRGVLLYGPPGSGKTLLAQAIAGEARCNAFVACSGSDFVDTFVGRGASRVRKLFDQARRDARAGGVSKWWSLRSSNHADMVPSAVIFIDEIDALAKSRSSFGNNDEREQTLNQLLAEMDGFATHDDDVTMIVIAATNRPDVLDPAIMRRFDRQIHVGYPNVDGREAILMVHARRVNCDMARIDWKHLASSSSAFSGADLRNVVNEAALLAVREQSSTVQQRHLEMAVERVKRMKAAVPSSLPYHMVVH